MERDLEEATGTELSLRPIMRLLNYRDRRGRWDIIIILLIITMIMIICSTIHYHCTIHIHNIGTELSLRPIMRLLNMYIHYVYIYIYIYIYMYREGGTTLESRDCPVWCAALTGSRLPSQAPAAP